MKRALLFLGYLLACLPAEAQNTGLEGQTLQPQWGDGFAPIPQGTHIWQVKNDSGQTWTLHGVSFYTDTGTSQLVSVHDDMNREFLVSPVTGSLAYAAGQLAAGATLGYGHSLTIKATFDGTTTLGQADIAVTHPQVDGTESAAISNISTVSPVGPFTGCGFQSSASGVAQISCTPSVQLTAGSVSFVYVVNGYGTATPTLQDNGTTVSPFPGYPKVAAGNSSVTLFVIPNESAGTHTFQTSNWSPVYPVIVAFNATGASLSSPVDGSPTTDLFTVPSSGNITCNAVTPTTANEFVLAFGWYESNNNSFNGQNVTIPPNANYNGRQVFAYGAASGVSPFAPSFSGLPAGIAGSCDTILVH